LDLAVGRILARNIDLGRPEHGREVVEYA